MNEFKKILAPLRRKLIFESFINKMIIVLAGSFIITAIIFIVSKFLYMENILFIVVGIFILSIVLGIAWAIIKKADFKESAKVGDSLGLKERLTTTFEILENKKQIGQMEKLLIDDTFSKSKEFDLKGLYKIKINKRNVKLSILLCLCMIVTAFIPYSSNTEFEKRLEFSKKLDSATKFIDTKVKEIEPKMKTAEKAKLAKEITDTKNF